MVIVVLDSLGILPDRQLEPGLRADQQDQQADHAGKHRPPDEDIGEGVHRLLLPAGPFGRAGSAAVSSILTAASRLELDLAAVTTCSPALTPSRIATSHLGRADAHKAPLDDESAAPPVSPTPPSRALAAPLDYKDAVAVEPVDDRGAGHGQHRSGFACRDRDIGEHAGQKLAFRIGEHGASRDVARFGADPRVDRLDLALETCGQGWRRQSC